MNIQSKINSEEYKKWSVRTDLAYDEAINHVSDLPDLIQSDEIIDDIPIYKSVVGPYAPKFDSDMLKIIPTHVEMIFNI